MIDADAGRSYFSLVMVRVQIVNAVLAGLMEITLRSHQTITVIEDIRVQQHLLGLVSTNAFKKPRRPSPKVGVIIAKERMRADVIPRRRRWRTRGSPWTRSRRRTGRTRGTFFRFRSQTPG